MAAVIEHGDQQMFLLALHDVTEARKISHVARETGLNRENLRDDQFRHSLIATSQILLFR
ncbi:DNA-binding protein [Candidatus Amarolinea aalborgensis]|jgi:DNA-binding phage protein|uniref:helix-turn-helix domain-containing transcriptional regulator n=1 Tax=Candidatus Amarolinea aalborgensis TaxID=2249329 RepID=UPI003BFA34E2